MCVLYKAHCPILTHKCLPYLTLETMSYFLHPDFLSCGSGFQTCGLKEP